jgi:hypothetical protein
MCESLTRPQDSDIPYFQASDIVVGFLTDVDGVYDRPPDQTGAVLLKNILVSSDDEVTGRPIVLVVR